MQTAACPACSASASPQSRPTPKRAYVMRALTASIAESIYSWVLPGLSPIRKQRLWGAAPRQNTIRAKCWSFDTQSAGQLARRSVSDGGGATSRLGPLAATFSAAICELNMRATSV